LVRSATLLSLLLACDSDARSVIDFAPAPNPSLPVVTWSLELDASLDDDDTSDVLEATHAWERATVASCPVRFDLGRRSPPLLTIAIRAELEPGKLGRAERHGDHATIALRPRGANTPGLRRQFRVTARHELGHVLGLSHRPDGVMASPTTSGITAQDVGALVCAAAQTAMHGGS
jgi:hypothetical protein